MFLSSLSALTEAPASQVYTSNKKITAKTPCHDRVGKAYHLALKEFRKGGDCFKPLADLGVVQYEGRERLLRSILEKYSTLALIPHTSEFDNSGVYCDKDFVFKVGARRLAYEMLVETAANETELRESAVHVIPFTYCDTDCDNKENAFSINIPTEDSDDTPPLIETLWRGIEKQSKRPEIAFGGIQSFMADKSVTVEQYSEKVMLALVVGLRDGKELHWKRLSDVEDSFPSRIDPPLFDSLKDFQTQAVAATDLLFLEAPYSTELLSKKQVDKLTGIVAKWNVDDIATKLGQQPILFYDLKAETCNEAAVRATDECGTPFTMEVGSPHLIDGVSFAVDVKKQQTILNPSQVAACKERMARIKEFVLHQQKEGKRFTALDLVKAADPFFQIYWDGIEESENSLIKTNRYTYIGREPLMKATNSSHCPELLDSLSQKMFERTQKAFTKDGFAGLPPLTGETFRKDSSLEEKSPPKAQATPMPPKRPFKRVPRARWFPTA